MHVNKLLTKIDVSKETRRKNKSNQVIYDFITMLCLISDIIPNEKMRLKILGNIKELFQGRMIKNSDFYTRENSITSAYLFVNKIVDFLYEENYNLTVI